MRYVCATLLLLALIQVVARSEETEWVKIAPEGSNFKAAFPGKPTESSNPPDVKDPKKASQLFTWVVSGSHILSAMYGDLSGSPTPKNLEMKVLEAIRDGHAKNLKGEVIADEVVKRNGLSGRQFTLKLSADRQARFLIFLQNDRLFQAMILGSGEEVGDQDAERFLKSFEVVPAGEGAKPELRLTGSPKTKDGAVLKGHTESVLGLSFSPDGSKLAAGSYDGALSLSSWAAGEGAWLGSNPKGVICVAFSPDGKLLASGGWDKSVKIWDVKAKKEVAFFQNLPDIVTALAFDPDGKVLAVGITDNTNDSNTMVKVFELPGNKEKTSLRGNEGRINWLTFTPDGQTLVSGSLNLLIWDVKEGKKKQEYKPFADCQLGAFWPDGKLRVFTTPSSWALDKPQTAGVITLLDPETNQTLGQFEGHSGMVNGMALSADRRLLASAGKEIKLWDVKGKKEVFSSTPSLGACAIALSADGRFLAAGSRDGTIRLWDLSETAPMREKP